MKKIFCTILIGSLFLQSCKKECLQVSNASLKVTTITINEITDSSARLYGALLQTGNSTVSEHGFCWSKNINPTTSGNKISYGSINSPQSFSNTIRGLESSQTYFFRAYAINSTGTVYGEELSFRTGFQCKDTSLYFDGIYINNTGSFNNDHVDIGANGPMSVIGANTSYTIEVWAKHGLVSYPNGLERIYSKDNVFQFRIVNNNFIGEIGNSSIQTPYPADTFWHHLAFVRDKASSSLKLFIDGQLKITTSDISGSVANNGSMVCIGARNNGGGIYELWTGNLKYLRVSNTARYSGSFTPTQRYVADINILGFWPFNDGNGNSLRDISGNNSNGTITNASWAFGKCQ